MRTIALIVLLLATAAGLPGQAGAQGLPQAAGSLIDENALRAYVSQQVAAGGQATRFDVQLGTLNTMALGPCRRTEPFMAAGARLWGRSSLGLRCTDGANWSVLLPVTVRAWGPALVAANPMPAGASLGADDVREQEVELTREPPGLLRDATRLQGLTLNRPVNPGQTLRLDMFRATLVVQAGDPVRLRINGNGFAITSTGQALNPAAEGQTLKVRTELGKVLTGIARAGRNVDVAL